MVDPEVMVMIQQLREQVTHLAELIQPEIQGGEERILNEALLDSSNNMRGSLADMIGATAGGLAVRISTYQNDNALKAYRIAAPDTTLRPVDLRLGVGGVWVSAYDHYDYTDT